MPFLGDMLVSWRVWLLTQISSFPNKALFWGLVWKGGNVALEWVTWNSHGKQAGLKMKWCTSWGRDNQGAFSCSFHAQKNTNRNGFQDYPSDEFFGVWTLDLWGFLVGPKIIRFDWQWLENTTVSITLQKTCNQLWSVWTFPASFSRWWLRPNWKQIDIWYIILVKMGSFSDQIGVNMKNTLNPGAHLAPKFLILNAPSWNGQPDKFSPISTLGRKPILSKRVMSSQNT